MRRALTLAERGWGRTRPNPMVGAVVVSDGRIVGEGFHSEFGGDHAEVVALRAAGEDAKGATMYVSLEPCNHTGTTPPCTEAIIRSGVAHVVFATNDPNPVARGGAERLRDAGVLVDSGLEEGTARELNAQFFHRFRADRPWINLKLAMSVDGAIADRARSAGWLTSEESRRVVHRMRAGVDAVAVGLGTVISDDPSLTVRGRVKPRKPPARVVFARSGSFPVNSVLARTASRSPTWFVTTDGRGDETGGLQKLGVRVVTVHDLVDGMRVLFSEGVHSILVEGGAQLAASLLDSGLVDRLTIFRAPIILGSGGLNAFASARPRLLADALRMPVVETVTCGGDCMTTYAITEI